MTTRDDRGNLAAPALDDAGANDVAMGRLDEAVFPIHHQLLRAFSHSNRAVHARTRLTGLKPGQPKVLEFVVAHEGCTQREIAEACVMDKSTVTSIVTRMEEEGLIIRTPSPADRRTQAVRLTDAGRAAADRVLAAVDEVDAIAWAGFTHEERTTLSQLLERAIDNLKTREEQD